jgi:hypothetical protein
VYPGKANHDRALVSEPEPEVMAPSLLQAASEAIPRRGMGTATLSGSLRAGPVVALDPVQAGEPGPGDVLEPKGETSAWAAGWIGGGRKATARWQVRQRDVWGADAVI